MQNLKLQEEIKSLKGLGQHFKDQLKLASIELGDFSDDDLALLDKCVQYYAFSHIYDLNLNFLRDYYYAKKRDSLENKRTKVKQHLELQRIKSAIEMAANDVAVLERFKAAAKERLIPDTVVLQRRSHQVATKQGLLDRQKTLKIPKDFNIESVIEKVDSLERR